MDAIEERLKINGWGLGWSTVSKAAEWPIKHKNYKIFFKSFHRLLVEKMSD